MRAQVVIAGRSVFTVMPGLVPGIHVFGSAAKEDVDGRDEPGHDDVSVERIPLDSSPLLIRLRTASHVKDSAAKRWLVAMRQT